MMTKDEKRAVMETADDYDEARLGYVDEHGRVHL